jgi:hypothetical protein
MAFAAVAGSVMIVHSIRSIFGARPPARPSTGSCRGT